MISEPRARSIPGPKGLPFLGIAPELSRDVTATVTRLMLEYGGIVRVPMPGVDAYLIVEPELVRTILVETEKEDGFGKPENISERLSRVIGNGLGTSAGELWRRQRRLANPAFHKQAISGFQTIIQKQIATMCARWDAVAKAGGTVEIADEMMRLTLDIVLGSLFSTNAREKTQAIGGALHELQDYFAHILFAPVALPLSVPTPRNLRAGKYRRQMFSIIDAIIEERRRKPKEEHPPDLLSTLMSAVDEQTGASMRDDQLRDELLTMIFAGHDTTAHGLAFTFHLLANNPHVSRKLEACVDAALGKRDPTMADLPQLEPVRMAFDEGMRLYPPLYLFARCPRRDVSYDGYVIPKGSVLFLSPYASHRCPWLWENPEAFDPDRFSAERSEKRHRFAYFPFGGGPRICIGANMALVEAQLILASVVSRYRLYNVPGRSFRLNAGVTLRPDPGIEMYVHRRDS